MIVITDRVVDAIVSTIGARPPESGGALFGPAHSNMISHFEFDPDAHTTSVVYIPSKRLVENVIPEVELREDVEFKGIIHSHPGLERPSSADLRAVAVQMNANGRLGSIVIPIVTFNGHGESSGHTYAINAECEMHMYRAYRLPHGDASSVDLVEDVARIVRVKENVDQVAALVGSDARRTFGTREINGVSYNRESLAWNGYELDMYFSEFFPADSPLVCLIPPGGDETDRENWISQTWGFGEAHVGTLRDRLESNLTQIS